MDNNRDERVPVDGRENLFADMSGLAKNENLDSEGFLKNLSDLIESDKYSDIAAHIIEDEMASERGCDNRTGSADAGAADTGDIYSGFSEEEFEDELTRAAKKMLADGSDGGRSPGYAFDDFNSENAEKNEYAENGENVGTGEEASEEPEYALGAESADEFAEEADSDAETQDLPAELTPEEAAAAKKRRLKYNILMACSILVFCYCVGRIAYYYYTGYLYNKGIDKLQNMVGGIATEPVITPEVVADIDFPDERVYASSAVNYQKEISEAWAETYANLVELNPDCVGWLQIPNTNINYPVMYTPEDYDKYLYTDFEGNYLHRGLPFMAEGTLLNLSQNYLLYGHNMQDGTAFRDLLKYLDNGWVRENQYAYFNTAFGEGVYQVMDVVITKIYNVDDECFKYYKYSGQLTEEEFNTYVYYMNKMSSIDTGVEAVYGDQLLTLSTCYKVYDENGRLVVVFKRVQ